MIKEDGTKIQIIAFIGAIEPPPSYLRSRYESKNITKRQG